MSVIDSMLKLQLNVICEFWLCVETRNDCCHSDLISAVKTCILKEFTHWVVIKEQPLFDSVSQASGGLMSLDFFSGTSFAF